MEPKEFKSFFKQVGGNEGNKCNYPTRLDTYGCGCGFNCDYCYAKSLLDFRGLWNAENPSVADIEKIKRKIARLPEDTPPIRLGGMTDCFQPIETQYHVTYETIKALNEKRQPYLIVTKSDLIARDEYIEILDKDLAHIQVTITCFDDALYKSLGYEHAPYPSARIHAIERLFENGFDVCVRLSPYIPEFVDYSTLGDIKCDKILVEFLRVNTWTEKWLNGKVDLSKYTVKQGNYKHLPLEEKVVEVSKVRGFKEVSVCEDETEAYEYWRNHFNPNPDDCCNLRRKK